MKELVIVSGKGGTGKTSISAALAFLAHKKIMIDCDVDAANFHLISGAVIRETHEFKAGFEPQINKTVCTHCGKCTALCRFGAIADGVITTPLNCEGCGVCAFNCPEHAIGMQEKRAGNWFSSDTRFGCLIHAELGLAIENSGKLVSKVRQEAKKIATAKHLPLIITDGPPGIGCPAIAALSGASLVLAVVEPSVSSMHDLMRLVDLVTHFNLPLAVCINKSTLHPENTKDLIAWCNSKALPIVGQVPYSDAFRCSVQSGKTVLEIPNVEVKDSLTNLWHNLAKYLDVRVTESKLGYLQRKLNPFR
ncbi:ATP-binding protein [Sporomusa malonica]|uniref:MinD superfamily P-loop ATPase, contains an inserted ferredoxin domain n=1 Tax=Sporomusa malonica TaxID=112901 RepID=A0A1W2EPI0_9FIRM|nr:ATP-binding protein [Sporomusa malonica]SMD11442.1 MinD superfamily P-loop ATPase, contains an inserted ferredoxin domain [Sporomusa malonica]